MKPSNNKKLNLDVMGYYKHLIKLHEKTGQKLFEARDPMRKGMAENFNPATGETQKEEEFKQWLDRLLMRTWYKFDLREDVEIPDEIKEKVDEDRPHPDDLSFDECEKLFYKITELFEKAGITRLEQVEWEEDPI